jgi:hypothetical protein
VNIIDVYHKTDSYRAAALLCGSTHKTVRRVVERQTAGGCLASSAVNPGRLAEAGQPALPLC